MSKAESKIQKSIIDWLTAKGCYVFKVMTANRAGVSDIIACYKGLFVALEVKTATGRASPLQLEHLRQIKAAGGIGRIVRSVDDVKLIFRKIDCERV